jgi:hypothetical protein
MPVVDYDNSGGLARRGAGERSRSSSAVAWNRSSELVARRAESWSRPAEASSRRTEAWNCPAEVWNRSSESVARSVMTLSEEMRAPVHASPALLLPSEPHGCQGDSRSHEDEDCVHKWDINDNTLPVVSAK